jgi:two-component system, response regulator YesN
LGCYLRPFGVKKGATVPDGFDGSRPTVLAVDDDDGVRAALTWTLEPVFRVLTAHNGRTALQTFASEPIDVVLLDLLLSEMHGHDVLTALRSRDPSAVVVIISAAGDIPTVVRSMKLGAWDYVHKPWDADSLVSTVHKAAREKQAASGVLLISEAVAELVPFQLALEPAVRAVTMNFKSAAASNFPANVVVVDARPEFRFDDVRAVRVQFPTAALVVLCPPNSPTRDLGDIRPAAVFMKPLHFADVLCSVQHLSHVSGRPLPPSVLTALDLMARRYREKVTVAQIAAAVSLSERRLTHIFREATGFSINDYFTRFRVAVARRLLIESTEKLDSVAHLAGFSDTSNFSRAFNDIAGVRPGRFRQRAFEEDLSY